MSGTGRLLEVGGVEITYGKKVAVTRASLEVGAGECVALLGTNGSGKSSVLKTIAGMIRQRRGTVSFDGRVADDLDVSARVRAGLILCPEGRQLFPQMSVYENLSAGAYMRKIGKEIIREEIAALGRYFPVLNERRDQKAGTLSGGEQQMVALGRALMGKPRLLLLDEPSLGLSPKLTKTVFEIIRSIVEEGCSILIAEQNVYLTLEVSNSAYILSSGTMSERYDSKDILANESRLSQLLGQ